MEGFASWGCESLHRSLATVIGGDDIGALEVDLIISPRAEVAVLIDHLGSDKGEVPALVIDTEADVIGCACGADGLGADWSAVFTGDDLDFAGLKSHSPSDMVFGGEAIRPVCHLDRSGEISRRCSR